MPGDKIEINQEHIVKAKIIFEELMKILPHKLEESEHGKIVISVSGGSGVGKSEIASLLAYYWTRKELEVIYCRGIIIREEFRCIMMQSDCACSEMQGFNHL